MQLSRKKVNDEGIKNYENQVHINDALIIPSRKQKKVEGLNQ
jgi:hypothetical protein